MPTDAMEFLLTRRSRPPKLLSAPGPDRAAIERLLVAATRVPDHGKLEPWRFVVLSGAGLARFAAAIRARAAATGDDPGQGRERLRAGPGGGGRGVLAEAERQDPGHRADALGRLRRAQPLERRAGLRLGRRVADRLAGLRPRR